MGIPTSFQLFIYSSLGLPLYDAEPNKLADLSGEPKYVMSIAVASIQNVQGFSDDIRNTLNDAAFRLDQTRMAETQFTYLQCTSLANRRKPVRVRLEDLDVNTTDDMRQHRFEAPNNQSDDPHQFPQGMPEMENIGTSTDLQRFTVRVLMELNHKGKAYHPNMRARIQKDTWRAFNRGNLEDDKGNPITNKHDVWPIIHAKQFLATLPKLALEMVKVHLVYRKAGIQIQWILPGQNNMSRLLKSFLGFNAKITKV